jgi:hypothetical protein
MSIGVVFGPLGATACCVRFGSNPLTANYAPSPTFTPLAPIPPSPYHPAGHTTHEPRFT